MLASAAGRLAVGIHLVPECPPPPSYCLPGVAYSSPRYLFHCVDFCITVFVKLLSRFLHSVCTPFPELYTLITPQLFHLHVFGIQSPVVSRQIRTMEFSLLCVVDIILCMTHGKEEEPSCSLFCSLPYITKLVYFHIYIIIYNSYLSLSSFLFPS